MNSKPKEGKPTQVAEKPTAIPSYKPVEVAQKPEGMNDWITKQKGAHPDTGAKEASQATPFLSPENTTYTSKQAHMVRGQVEMGNNAPVELVSTSPPKSIDRLTQDKLNTASAKQVDQWVQNRQGSSGKVDNLLHSPSSRLDSGATPYVERKGKESYLGIGSTPIQDNLNTAGFDLRHPGASPWTGSTDIRANPSAWGPATALSRRTS